MRKFLAMAVFLSPLLWATWGWQPLPVASGRSLVRIDMLAAPDQVPAPEGKALGPFTMAGLWRLSSDNPRFGGFSALVPLPSQQFLAVSDRNGWLRFAGPEKPGRYSLPSGATLVRRLTKGRRHENFDVEAVVRDPADGSLWFGLESEWHVARIGGGDVRARFAGIPQIKDWPVNGGVEAMARLADGRWIMLCESCGSGRGGLHRGLLFAGYPGLSAAQNFGIVVPPGFDPVDMAQLPDGRVLILVRRFNLFPPRFTNRLVLADFARLDPKRPLGTRELARIEGPTLRENYEGMAIREEAGGQLAVWLLSDANDSAFQETRLMHLLLDPAKLPDTR
ncbi:esterase-like activity of phytase family protein [Novosphingobium sp. MMS21-SN21R]|uniref:esterase-like activity of phytase family protein n=1 Tax=Novosphingobium sp. MMS21-SN21R TaxID=2969298 RepID=UPI002884DB6F|nr:esterase-like activity of phytase family protein [Novosphingobium sp. MMS21-SN21R]MDT0506399.1 esterase-like activity of phytase family protein [Novosphingobium sp. MMS21-SN21R]